MMVQTLHGLVQYDQRDEVRLKLGQLGPEKKEIAIMHFADIFKLQHTEEAVIEFLSRNPRLYDDVMGLV